MPATTPVFLAVGRSARTKDKNDLQEAPKMEQKWNASGTCEERSRNAWNGP